MEANIKEPTYSNNLERRYGQLLDLQLKAGEIKWWRLKPLRIRLADGSYYTPDFAVVTNEDQLELHETKGHMREAARVRMLVCREVFPAAIRLIIWDAQHGWQEEIF
jgi:hypothetical protein